MGFIVHIHDPIFTDGHEDLRRSDVFVSQKLLKGFDVRSVLDHVRRKGIAQDLGRELAAQIRLIRVFLNDFPYTLTGDPISQVIQK